MRAMNAANCRTLCAIFARPTSATVDWDDFTRLVRACGGEVSAGSGSRRKARLNGRIGVFHAPHPGSVMKKGSVDSARIFLETAGVTPASEGCRC